MTDPLYMDYKVQSPCEIIKDLISIPSYKEGPKMEGKLVDYIASRFEDLNIEYDLIYLEEKKIGIAGVIGEGPNSLILHSHLDTVPPSNIDEWNSDPLKPKESDGKIYGLGACDTKGSLASMLAVFENIAKKASDLNGQLVFLAVGAEERGGLGTKAAIEAGYKADAVVLGEPTRLKPLIAHKGVLRLNITTKGKPAHASSPEEGINAISLMAKIIPKLDELAVDIANQIEEFTGNASMAITKIEGGTALNVIPGSCSISIDRRLIPGQDEEYAYNEIKSILKNEEEKHDELDIKIERIRGIKPSKTNPEDPIAELSLQVAEEVLGEKLVFSGFPAGCDMTYFRHRSRIPVVILGPGDINNAHKKNEYVKIDSLDKAARIYNNISIRWLQ